MKDTNSFLKGNYSLKTPINDDDQNNQDEFKEKAINSIGGSMVFVERKKMIWTGPEKLNMENENKNSEEKKLKVGKQTTN